MMLPATIAGWMKKFGDDFGFMPLVPVLEQNGYDPGSPERVNEMRRRLRNGQPLFSRYDSAYYSGSKERGFERYSDDPKWTVWRGTKEKGEELSVCGKYRYRTWDVWDLEKPIALCIGLYPRATIDAAEEAKIRAMARTHECGGVQRVNLFGRKLKSGGELWDHESPVGDWNDRVIRIALMSCSFVVCHWGIGGVHLGRSAYMFTTLDTAMSRERIFCFGLTERVAGANKAGRFSHPVPIRAVEVGSPLMNVPYKFVETAAE